MSFSLLYLKDETLQRKKRALSPFPADAIFINIKHGIAEENEKHKRLSMHLKLALKVK